MAPSQLKQLKASVRERRAPNGHNTAKATTKVPRNDQKAENNRNRRPKSFSEETRRRTLLTEIQHRHKVGGIIDRRIGENDPTMTPEERMLQRYARQRSKKDSIFNLEEAGEEENVVQLTHLGRAVGKDDFDDVDVSDDGSEPPVKKRRLSDRDDGDDSQQETDIKHLVDAVEVGSKKSKKEVMREVIAKSKLYKYERQQTKEDVDNLREKLDKDLPDLLAMLKSGKAVQPKEEIQLATTPTMMHPDRAAQIVEDPSNEPEKYADKVYDTRLKQMAQDRRAQPTERTKTEEERATEAAEMLKELEAKRLMRMKGEEEEDKDEEESQQETDDEDRPDVLDQSDTNNDPGSVNEAAAFGFNDAKKEVAGDGVEDEDEFVIEENLVASGSEIDTDLSEFSGDTGDESGRENDDGLSDEDDADFLKVLEESRATSLLDVDTLSAKENLGTSHLAYTYPCPQTHEELLKIVKNIDKSELVTVIQRIRALHHSSLNSQNKEKLSKFAVSLVDHIHYMAINKSPLQIIEKVIRHIHSLAKTYSDAVSISFRSHLKRMYDDETMNPGDLLILTAIGSIYPTSDHFHQVVTPAITIIARWLGLHQPRTSTETLTGSYLVWLCLEYQNLSKRYIPEAVNFTCAAIERASDTATAETQVKSIERMTELWGDQMAFLEIFSPDVLKALRSNQYTAAAARKFRIQLSQAQLRRRPLELHHHRPLPIKTAIPKFEESYNPDKHYDPDRERAEASKLRHEYKRERKGAIRELKKDASFIAREKLRVKKAADKAYEAKQRRLIAEIQTEEGREKNAYEREKRARKGRK